MSRKTTNKQQGFTIIELLIATIVFSLLLIVMLAAFIRTGDLFYKGVSMSKTQNDARNIVQSIGNDIQFSKGGPSFTDGSNMLSADISHNPTGVFCVGGHRYAYQIGQQVGQGNNVYGLARDTTGGSCLPVAIDHGVPQFDSNSVQMLNSGMQLNKLVVNCPSLGGSTSVCHVEVYVVFYGASGAYGSPEFLQSADDQFSGTGANSSRAPDAQCKGALNDTDLCATVDYSSTVLVQE